MAETPCKIARSDLIYLDSTCVGFCRSSLPLLLNFNRWGKAFNSVSPLFEELGVMQVMHKVKPNMQHLQNSYYRFMSVMPVEPVPKALLHPGSEIWIGGRNRTGFPKVTSLFTSQLARVLVPNCSSAIYLVSHKTKSCTDLALSMHQPNNQLWPTSFKNSAALVPLLKQLCCPPRTVDKAPSKPRPWYDWMICWDTVRLLTRDIDIFKNWMDSMFFVTIAITSIYTYCNFFQPYLVNQSKLRVKRMCAEEPSKQAFSLLLVNDAEGLAKHVRHAMRSFPLASNTPPSQVAKSKEFKYIQV